jgi:hypothetical protein
MTAGCWATARVLAMSPTGTRLVIEQYRALDMAADAAEVIVWARVPPPYVIVGEGMLSGARGIGPRGPAALARGQWYARLDPGQVEAACGRTLGPSSVFTHEEGVRLVESACRLLLDRPALCAEVFGECYEPPCALLSDSAGEDSTGPVPGEAPKPTEI